MRTFSGRNASQEHTEIGRLVDLMRDLKATSYLEVGARHGDTFHYVMCEFPKSMRGVAVDLPGGAWGKADTGSYLHRCIDNLAVRGYYDVHMLLGSSHDVAIQQKVSEFGQFDFCLIDADHRYEPAKQDFTDYSRLCRYLAFHDIVGFKEGTNFEGYRADVEVPRLWAEIKPRYKHWEFIGMNSAMGIGVIDLQTGTEDSK